MLKLVMECYVENEGEADKVAKLVCETFKRMVMSRTEEVKDEEDDDEL